MEMQEVWNNWRASPFLAISEIPTPGIQGGITDSHPLDTTETGDKSNAGLWATWLRKEFHMLEIWAVINY